MSIYSQSISKQAKYGSDDLQGRWFVLMLQQSRGGTDWERDGGLLCLGFKVLGIDSRFIALGPACVHKSEPRIDVTIEQVMNPIWWRQWDLDGVVLYSWAAPRYECVARAVSEAGLRCVLKIDSDGYKSPCQGWLRYVSNSYMYYRDTRKRWPGLKAVLKTVLFGMVPAVHDLPMLRHLGYADIIGIESPMAVDLLCDLLRRYQRDELTARVRLSPHPVTTDMKYNASVPKEMLIMAVGRWDAWQKDAPRLVNVLDVFLHSEPEYRAELIGTGSDALNLLLASVNPVIRSRIQVLGPVPHAELPLHYQRAQVLLFTSRSEGCPVAGEEALCCGCSIVGSACLPSLNWLCGEDSGTLAADRSVTALSTALRAEVNAWRSGLRESQRISALWTPRFQAPHVARHILHAVAALDSSLPSRRP